MPVMCHGIDRCPSWSRSSSRTLAESLTNSFQNRARYSELDKMIPTSAFQPKWLSIYTRFQFQVLATTTTGGEANWVSTPPTEMLTNNRPRVAYFNGREGF